MKKKGREYSKSLEFGDLVLDIDRKGFITGLRIFDAAGILKVSKEALQNITKFSLHTKVLNKVIAVNLTFTAMVATKQLNREKNFIHRATDMKLNNSEALCTVA